MMPLPNENARPPSRPVAAAEDAAPRSREEFCRALKAARQRRGVTLDHISKVTKVCATYFEGLERNDLQHWPKGIFRRAFFRGYVEQIGLPVTESIEEFLRLFPDDGHTATLPAVAAVPANPLRLGLDRSWHGPKIPIKARMLTAAIDGVLVFAIAGGLVLWTSLAVATCIAIASVTYFLLSRILFNDSPARLLSRVRVTRSSEATAAAPDAPVEVEELAEESEERHEPESKRVWISDARRVRARDGRMRVRIKMPPTHSVHH
jgi:cytoskeletal protein RodZ